MQPVVCHCCGQYVVEEIRLDELDGAGERRLFRLTRRVPDVGVYPIAEARDLDGLAEAIDARGLLMWPDDGCE